MRQLKSSTLLAILFALVVPTANAKPTSIKHSQNKHISIPVKFGAKLGVNNSLLNDVSRNDMQDRLLLRSRFDLYGEYKLNNTLGAQLSLMYLGQGQKEAQSRTYLDYILLAPSLRWYPGSGRQFCLFIGPQISYLINATEVEPPAAPQNLLQGPGSDNRRKVDAGLLFGLDYEFDINLILGLSWNVGFMSVTRGSNPPSTNLSTSLYLGYNFGPLVQ